MEITLDELISAREECLQREELKKSQSAYKREIFNLEQQTSETLMKLENIERDLLKMNAYVDQINSDKMKIYKSLIDENKSLKKLHTEANDLKMQAHFTYVLKEVFKKKYEEAIVGNNAVEPLTDSSDQTTALEIDQLQQKLIETEAQIAEVIKEKEYMKKKVIPVLESTLKLYEQNKRESEARIEELKQDLKNRLKRNETHSASPVGSKSQNSKSSGSSSKPETSKITAKTPKSKAYMPSYLSHPKPGIKRSEKNLK
jgi:chromosome segregation ATPase